MQAWIHEKMKTKGNTPTKQEDTKFAQNLKNTTIQNYFCIIHGLLSQISLQDSTHIMSHTSANRDNTHKCPQFQ